MANTVTELLRRRFGGKKESKVNLLDYADQPHGNLVNYTTSAIAQYPLLDTIQANERVKIILTAGENWVGRGTVYIYNSSPSASASRTTLGNMVNGVLEHEFDWLVYGNNSYIRVVSFGSGSYPTMTKAELYRV